MFDFLFLLLTSQTLLFAKINELCDYMQFHDSVNFMKANSREAQGERLLSHDLKSPLETQHNLTLQWDLKLIGII